MNNKNINIKELEKEYEKIRKSLQSLIRNDDPFISLTTIKNYLWKDRLARLIFICIAIQKKCFINEIISEISEKYKIKAPYKYFTHRTSRLAQFNLIEIHKLYNQKDEEMIKRYDLLNTKCPKTRINYFEFVLNFRNLKLFEYCLELEGLKYDK